MKPVIFALAFSAFATSMQTLAEPEVVYTPNTKFQTVTSRLLAQQSSGQNASSQEQHLSGKVSTEVYNRYVKSFSHPIPERFGSDSFKAE
ncbi:DUF3613 domain-containing protein [Zhongshania guokunii]|uniref:DUF3613 domain-containing protein n=1 Tax=Zhongshania guokunii TaxID=641783 RepID=A0ABV3U1E3_9GAMM